jgi:hypothetical protein
MSPIRVLTLYSKPGCHLCEDLRSLLEELRDTFVFDIEEIDITRDPALFALYRHEIPVLLMDGVEIGRGRISELDLTRRVRQGR